MPVHNEKQRLTLDADEPISVTVDATDLTGASAEPLKAVIARYGRPISARAFADFQQTSLSELAVQLYQLGFTLVHCPTWPNGDGFPKPIVTDVLAQDLRDQLEELEGIETYLLVATSREYIAAANALRRHDKRVIVVAEEARVSRELRLCADEFVALPPTKVERVATTTRTTRTTARTAVTRQERVSEPARHERPLEVARPEPVSEMVRPVSEPARIEKAPEPVRIERPAAKAVERAPEPVREAAKAESPELRLPTDVEVVAEVRRIVAAEGICTPRRLARALCPIDRTPTGELRSRIANRIQTLLDSGKLLREKLVVGGTSVETIIVGEDRNGRSSQASAEGPLALPHPADEAVAAREPVEEPAMPAGNGVDHGASVTESTPPVGSDEYDKHVPSPVRDLDAFVESVLRSSDSTALRPADEAEPEQSSGETAVPETEAPAQEAPAKRTRSRRRSPAKKAAGAEKNASPEPEAAS